MTRRIVIIQGHPDPAGHHLLHAMADAYSEGATAARHEVRRIEVAKLAFPLLRTQLDFETGARNLATTWVGPSTGCFYFRSGMERCQPCSRDFSNIFSGLVFLWNTKREGFPKRLLAGRSARIVVTVGMRVLMYRWYFGAYGLRGFERGMLSFAGITPIRESLYWLTFAAEKKRARWIEDMRSHGRRGD
jgi:putative NADPH-quinone reductase